MDGIKIQSFFIPILWNKFNLLQNTHILFTVERESCFYSINFDGTDLRKIKVNLPASLFK